MISEKLDGNDQHEEKNVQFYECMQEIEQSQKAEETGATVRCVIALCFMVFITLLIFAAILFVKHWHA